MLDNSFVCFGDGKRLTVYVLMKGTTEHLGGALGHGNGVWFGFEGFIHHYHHDFHDY